MTIKEVEQNLNVPRATVRFYEKEGLLSPVRGENGYREYSEEDVVSTFVGMLVIEIVVAVPTYFYLKKHPKAKKKNVELWMALGILVILVVGLVVVKLVK